MQIKYDPKFQITPKIARTLMRIEAIKEKVSNLPLSPKVLMKLRETAKLYSTHYSTMIEGNRLTQGQVKHVLRDKEHFPGRERDEREVKGYYAALGQVDNWAARNIPLTEHIIQILHAIVMADGELRVKPTEYRDGQNVIRDIGSGRIVYLPPEAKDVPGLMAGLVRWIRDSSELPCPIVGGIAHYQFATIHPYYDGNGRTARLLATLILHLGGYDLKGIYSLEEYYARNLDSYYAAIDIGESHNYYLGRANAEITSWIEYFCQGMVEAFENVSFRMEEADMQQEQDYSPLLRKLDPKQRKALELFLKDDEISAHQISILFGFQPRTGAALCQRWVKEGFLVIGNPSNKNRTYRLASALQSLLSKVNKVTRIRDKSYLISS